jgi:hypothetical protein
LTVGGNFSSYAKVLEFKNNQWQAIDTLDFIPIQAIRLNNSDYLAGGMYNEGRNYFKDQLILVPFAGGKLAKEYRLEKKLAPFYTLDFSSFAEPQQQEAGESRGNITGVHMIDTEYNNRFYAGDFQERTSLLEKRGSALAVLNGQWLAMSAYTFSKQEDKLFFYKIAEGSKQLIYENSLNGRVMFISAGSWQAQQGFWVYVEEMKNNTPSYRLQFWSKNIEKEGNNQG